jgi:hypothetical protein
MKRYILGCDEELSYNTWRFSQGRNQNYTGSKQRQAYSSTLKAKAIFSF